MTKTIASEIERIANTFKDLDVPGKYITSFRWLGWIASVSILVFFNDTVIIIAANTDVGEMGTPTINICHERFEIGEFTEKHAEDIMLIVFGVLIE